MKFRALSFNYEAEARNRLWEEELRDPTLWIGKPTNDSKDDLVEDDKKTFLSSTHSNDGNHCVGQPSKEYELNLNNDLNELDSKESIATSSPHQQVAARSQDHNNAKPECPVVNDEETRLIHSSGCDLSDHASNVKDLVSFVKKQREDKEDPTLLRVGGLDETSLLVETPAQKKSHRAIQLPVVTDRKDPLSRQERKQGEYPREHDDCVLLRGLLVPKKPATESSKVIAGNPKCAMKNNLVQNSEEVPEEEMDGKLGKVLCSQGRCPLEVNELNDSSKEASLASPSSKRILSLTLAKVATMDSPPLSPCKKRRCVESSASKQPILQRKVQVQLDLSTWSRALLALVSNIRRGKTQRRLTNHASEPRQHIIYSFSKHGNGILRDLMYPNWLLAMLMSFQQTNPIAVKVGDRIWDRLNAGGRSQSVSNGLNHSLSQMGFRGTFGKWNVGTVESGQELFAVDDMIPTLQNESGTPSIGTMITMAAKATKQTNPISFTLKPFDLGTSTLGAVMELESNSLTPRKRKKTTGNPPSKQVAIQSHKGAARRSPCERAKSSENLNYPTQTQIDDRYGGEGFRNLPPPRATISEQDSPLEKTKPIQQRNNTDDPSLSQQSSSSKHLSSQLCNEKEERKQDDVEGHFFGLPSERPEKDEASPIDSAKKPSKQLGDQNNIEDLDDKHHTRMQDRMKKKSIAGPWKSEKMEPLGERSNENLVNSPGLIDASARGKHEKMSSTSGPKTTTIEQRQDNRELINREMSFTPYNKNLIMKPVAMHYERALDHRSVSNAEEEPLPKQNSADLSKSKKHSHASRRVETEDHKNVESMEAFKSETHQEALHCKAESKEARKAEKRKRKRERKEKKREKRERKREKKRRKSLTQLPATENHNDDEIVFLKTTRPHANKLEIEQKKFVAQDSHVIRDISSIVPGGDVCPEVPSTFDSAPEEDNQTKMTERLDRDECSLRPSQNLCSNEKRNERQTDKKGSTDKGFPSTIKSADEVFRKDKRAQKCGNQERAAETTENVRKDRKGAFSLTPERNNRPVLAPSIEPPRNNFSSLQPLPLLCAEKFIENWPEAIAELSSGRWTKSLIRDRHKTITKPVPDSAVLGRKITFIDSSIIDKCKIDIELPGRRGIVVWDSSNWTDKDLKDAQKFILGLATDERYELVWFVLRIDSIIDQSHSLRVAKLQKTLAGDNCSLQVQFHATSLTALSCCLAEIVLKANASTMTKSYAAALKLVSNDVVSQRASFLVQLLSTITASDACFCITAGASPEKTSKGFQLLVKSEIERKRLCTIDRPTDRPDVWPKAMLQLSYILKARLEETGGETLATGQPQSTSVRTSHVCP